MIVGHSERRSVFGDTDAMVAKKARAVLDAGMTPIVAVGESLEQREAGEAEAVITGQLLTALAPLEPAEVARADATPRREGDLRCTRTRPSARASMAS